MEGVDKGIDQSASTPEIDTADKSDNISTKVVKSISKEKKFKLDQKNKKKLKSVLPIMKLLKDSKDKQESSSILSTMNDESFTSVCSCLYNALYGNILDPDKRKQFRSQFNEQRESVLKMVQRNRGGGLQSKKRKQLCCDNYNCFKFLICECYPIIERSVK